MDGKNGSNNNEASRLRSCFYHNFQHLSTYVLPPFQTSQHPIFALALPLFQASALSKAAKTIPLPSASRISTSSRFHRNPKEFLNSKDAAITKSRPSVKTGAKVQKLDDDQPLRGRGAIRPSRDSDKIQRRMRPGDLSRLGDTARGTDPSSSADGVAGPSSRPYGEDRRSGESRIAELPRASITVNKKFKLEFELWAEIYYADLLEPKYIEQKREIRRSLTSPTGFRRDLRRLDSILSRKNAPPSSWTVEEWDRNVSKYKALRDFFYYFNKTEFISGIDRDADWIMGYLKPTYLPAIPTPSGSDVSST